MFRLQGHIATCGGTESGKSNSAKFIAKLAYDAKTPVLVCDPFLYNDWPCDWITANPEKFLTKARQSTGCLLVVDECGEMIGRSGLAEQMKWLVRASRHQGHKVVLAMHRATDVLPTFRDNVSNLLLFNVAADSAQIWAETFLDRALLRAPDLPQFHFALKRRFQPARFFNPLPVVSK